VAAAERRPAPALGLRCAALCSAVPPLRPRPAALSTPRAAPQVLFNLHEPDHQHCHHGTHVPLLPCSFHDSLAKGQLGFPSALRKPLLMAAASLGEPLPLHGGGGGGGGGPSPSRGGSFDALALLGGSRQHSAELGPPPPQLHPAGPLEDGAEEHGHAHHGGGAEHAQQHEAPHAHGHAHAPGRLRYRHALMLMLALSAHTALESLALGFLADWHGFSVLLGAIASHKLISALALSTRFLKEGASARQVVLFAGPFTLVAPAAIAAGSYMGGLAPVLELALLCGATGTFLYIGTTEVRECAEDALTWRGREVCWAPGLQLERLTPNPVPVVLPQVLAEEFEGDSTDGMAGWAPAPARHLKFLAVMVGVGAMAAVSFLPE
jgi:hypothetical protein